MNKKTLVLSGVIILVIIGTVTAYRLTSRSTSGSPPVQSDPVQSESSAQPEADAPAPSAQPTVFYPVIGYSSRITNRGHGQSTTLADSAGFPCGGQFEGIHVGDDLEVTAAETSQEIPVFALAAGKVRQASVVGGYGGLLVTEHDVDDRVITAYYGHVDLNQVKFKAGETFTAGALLTYLGDSCTTETSDERKHLHFAIRLGASLDVRGYLSNQAELNEWLNPKEWLKEQAAAEPLPQ